MNVFTSLYRLVRILAQAMNYISGVCVLAMMGLTCADVVLRLFRYPIPGTYEMVGFLGALAVSFALAKTSLERGHIAVGFLVQRVSPDAQKQVDRINALVLSALFGLISWYSLVFALASHRNHEVSMTLQMPIHPFIIGISACFAMLFIISTLRFILSFEPSEKEEL
ncbi:MAG: TRAP transporter small permease [Proteobacteria bacterium]|nr:TRAP transporter small permease [Pseudomonadota bacterium]